MKKQTVTELIQHKNIYFLLVFLCSIPCGFAQETVAPVRDEAEVRQLDFANGWLLRGNYEQAAREYEKFLQDYPDSNNKSLALYRLGESYYLLKDYEKAATVLEQALALLTDYEKRKTAQYRLGEVKYHLRRFQASLDLLGNVLVSGPGPEVAEAAIYYRGKDFLELDMKDEARTALQQLLDEHSDGNFIYFAAYELGQLYREKDQFDKAVAMYNLIEEATPGNPKLPGAWILPEAHYREGEILYAQEKYAQATDVLAEGLRKFPDSDLSQEMAYSLAWSQFGLKDYDQALAMAQEQIQSSTDDSRLQGLYLLKGNSLYEMERYSGSSEAFQTAAEKISDSPDSIKKAAEALSRLSWSLYFTQEYDRALASIDKAQSNSSIGPYLGDLKFLKGQILYIQKDYQKALYEFLDVLANHRESRFYEDVGYRMGWCYHKMEQFNEAAEIWFTYAVRFPDIQQGQEAALMAAEATFKMGDFQKALQRFDYFIDTYPDLPSGEGVLYKASIACHNLKNYSKMSGYLKELLKRFPESQYQAEAYYWLGFSATMTDDSESAKHYYETLADKNPDSQYAPDALFRLAKIYYKAEELDQAGETFLRILKHYPKYDLPAEIQFWVGSQMSDKKRYGDAYIAYSSIWEKHPGSMLRPRARFEAGQNLLQQGEFEQAVQLYRTMLAENPSDLYHGQALFGLGEALMKQEKYEEALHHLNKSQRDLSDELAADSAFKIGLCHKALGQNQEAFDSFMRVAILYDIKELSSQSLWQAGQAMEMQNNWPEAEKVYRELIDRYSETEWGKKARSLLNEKAIEN